MKGKFIFFLSVLSVVFLNSLCYGYIELSSKTEVSPGCEGGILSQTGTSVINDPCILEMQMSLERENG